MLSFAKFISFIRSGSGKKKMPVLVSGGFKLTGFLHAKGPGIFSGDLTGDFQAEQDIAVQVPGKIEGNLSGLNFAINGTVNGNILGLQGVNLLKDAVVNGAITAQSLEIETGAGFNGPLVIGSGEKDQVHNLKNKR